MRSGVPIMESLDIVGDTAGNAVVALALRETRERVRLGESISVALSAADHVFPPMVIQMISVGEETGAIDELLEKIADFYDGEVQATVDSLTSLIEPLLMVFMGVVGRRHGHRAVPADVPAHQPREVAGRAARRAGCDSGRWTPVPA